MELSESQLQVAEAIQLNIDRLGAVMVPFSLLNDTFGDNTDGFSWLADENHWKLQHDRILSLTTITQTGTYCSDELPIRKLMNRLRRMARNNVTEEEI